jgi:hypothetical protein
VRHSDHFNPSPQLRRISWIDLDPEFGAARTTRGRDDLTFGCDGDVGGLARSAALRSQGAKSELVGCLRKGQ